MLDQLSQISEEKVNSSLLMSQQQQAFNFGWVKEVKDVGWRSFCQRECV